MEPDRLLDLTRILRRKPIYTASPTACRVDHGLEQIHQMLPHRPPFRYVERIDGVDMARQCILAHYSVDPEDPLFQGHFPGQPLFPGVLQIEAMGQAMICAMALLHADGEPDSLRSPNVRATRVHSAVFQASVLPGDGLSLHAGVVSDDGLKAVGIGQVYKADKLCCYSVLEVCYVD